MELYAEEILGKHVMRKYSVMVARPFINALSDLVDERNLLEDLFGIDAEGERFKELVELNYEIFFEEDTVLAEDEGHIELLSDSDLEESMYDKIKDNSRKYDLDISVDEESLFYRSEVNYNLVEVDREIYDVEFERDENYGFKIDTKNGIDSTIYLGYGGKAIVFDGKEFSIDSRNLLDVF